MSRIIILLVTLFLFFLPYYLFDGRLFLGGDDTRFYYAYPREVLNNLALYSWNNISSLSTNIPNFHSVPFLLLFSFIESFFSSKIAFFYFCFSLPSVLGFIYFQKFIRELTNCGFDISIISALIYVLSPITLVSLSFFLTPVWLLALFPIISYYFICFIKRGKYRDLLKVVLWSIIFSIAFFTIAWVLGLIIPLFFGLIIIVFVKKPSKLIIKRSITFWYFIICSQLFWFIPFFMSLVSSGANDLGSEAVSDSFINSFALTVRETASGNVLYPLLNFYQREIAFNYDWQLKNIFKDYFDKFLLLSTIYIFVLFVGLLRFNRALSLSEKRIFIFFLSAFILVLYFSTVNIGFLKEIFIILGNIPGFALFRNFTDKFSVSFVFIYSTLLSLCLLVVKKESRFYRLIVVLVLLALIINFSPIKKIINAPLWKTKDIYTTVNLPKEYLSFVSDVKSLVPNETNIIAFPQNIASYSVISEGNSRNAYVGTSPFKFFTGINDLSGEYSYPENISHEIKRDITEQNAKEMLTLLSEINVGYLMVTNNIPDQILRSYLFEKDYLKLQNMKFIQSLVDREVIRSEKGSYIIYKLKNNPKIISSTANIEYKKINPIFYKIYVKGLKKNEKLVFLETYNSGWKIYLNQDKYYNKDILSLISLMNPVFNNSHKQVGDYGNMWKIGKTEIENEFNTNYYSINKDESIDVELLLFFLPQLYFYIGTASTVIFMFIGVFVIYKFKK